MPPLLIIGQAMRWNSMACLHAGFTGTCEKTWDDLKKLFSKECRDTHELQLINATQSGFHGSNMAITTKCGIAEALEELAMAKNSEKYVHTQLTSIH